MTPYIPKYVSPEQAARDRARLLYWLAVGVPVGFAIFAFDYCGQAPEALRAATIALDRSLGYPILNLISVIGSR